ncbi:MAG: YCF48-related protein [Ignavibacteriaceae bacterium]|nr:YCF48-related protein [Ignavibacteriaceae bacterium]
MKTVSITILLIALFLIPIFAQSNWSAQNSGTNSSLDAVYFVDENNGWVTGWGGIILHTTNGGQTWGLQNTPATSLICVFFTDLQNGWAAGFSGEVVHTTNGGETWTSQDISTNDDINKLFFIDDNTGYAAGGFFDFLSGSYGRAIYNTTDGGNNWNVQYDMTFQTELNSIYFIDSNTGYAAGGTGIMKTTNGGSNWFVQQNLSSFGLKDIFFTNSNTGFVAGKYQGIPHYSVIFKTTDGGNNWNEISLGTDEDLSGLYFTDELNGWAVGVDYSSGNNLALIYRTTDGGNNWVKQNIPSFNNLASVFFINGTKGWAVGELGTIITYDGQVPVEVTVDFSPTEFMLAQNYPNPFNPSTTIEYSIPESGNVKLIVYNSLGEEVTVLKNDFEEAGSYKINFYAQNVPSGIYFYKIESGRYNDVKKMILLK